MRHVTPSRRPQSPDMKLSINGADVEVDDRHAKTPLLWVLRDVLGLRGTKFGCGIGYCAACTVLLNRKNTKSCQTPAERAVGKNGGHGRAMAVHRVRAGVDSKGRVM